ncbi:MAG: sigma-54-dependent Fis family transcriptional regulator [Deltaproteobacteria bacterium]|uniref:Sigma-54-dependent Fis family transcriptional regulator n=1 Tax=Candidatus Zymogenus saltonus TaxID=2844893 RepID=A0A9D8K9J3_9DELT|nr:sigma-54-dependent Fis family transcriptional regulator [Candidatus Zymogenus saltonus]
MLNTYLDESILVVDDEEGVLLLLDRMLEREGYKNVFLADSAESALEKIYKENITIVLTDVRMPGMDGIELLEKVKVIDPSIIVIIITAHGSIDLAVECIKKGAYDLITKPFGSEIVTMTIEKALEERRLKDEIYDLRMSVTKSADFMDFVGVSEPMQRVYEKIKAVAPTDAPVLITGESGTGKELAIRAIHELSTRKDMPLVSVSCPNLPEQMLESELFGHVKGAFTDAYRDKKGLFEKADKGTLFLDEIGDISPDVQVKLLRALQEGEILPLGSEKVKKLDVRVITSTNKDLTKKVNQGKFREDLFYRINVINICMPPLRERSEDIRRLSSYFLAMYSAKLSKPIKGITDEALEYLKNRDWNGNVRELMNKIYNGVVFAKGDLIEISDITPEDGIVKEDQKSPVDLSGESFRDLRGNLLDRFESNFVKDALKSADGNVSKAARESGLSRQSFQHLMRKYGIKSDDIE